MSAHDNLTETPAMQWLEQRAQNFVKQFDSMMDAIFYSAAEKLGGALTAGVQKLAEKGGDAMRSTSTVMDRFKNFSPFPGGKKDDPSPSQQQNIAIEAPGHSQMQQMQTALTAAGFTPSKDIVKSQEIQAVAHEVAPSHGMATGINRQQYALGM